MALFTSTFINKVDRKGRVSVPASFRSALTSQSFSGIVAFRSLKFVALDGGGFDRLEQIAQSLDELPEFSDEREGLASILADAHEIPFDSEGRIVLPQRLVDYAGIGEQAAFVGLGRSFQIWDPTRYEAHQEEMRERVRQRGFTLPPRGVAR